MHLRLLPFNNIEYTSDLHRNIMNNFLISYNYLKNAFIRKSVPFPTELGTILEPASTTTTLQSSANSNNSMGRLNVNSVLLCYFAAYFVLPFSMTQEIILLDSVIYFVLEYRQ